MKEALERTRRLLGDDAMERLSRSRVAVFGLGGVGGHVAEALARSGIGALDLIDNDAVSLSNLNRQIIATLSTVGLPKTQAAKDRVLSVAPDCRVTTYETFFLPETAGLFDFSAYDFAVDAIDTVAGKIELAERCRESGTPLIASMGTGNKLDPGKLCIGDLFSTETDPLARVMRRELRLRGFRRLTVLWSTEEPRSPLPPETPDPNRRSVPASVAFVPGAAGLFIAAKVIRLLSGAEEGLEKAVPQ